MLSVLFKLRRDGVGLTWRVVWTVPLMRVQPFSLFQFPFYFSRDLIKERDYEWLWEELLYYSISETTSIARKSSKRSSMLCVCIVVLIVDVDLDVVWSVSRVVSAPFQLKRHLTGLVREAFDERGTCPAWAAPTLANDIQTTKKPKNLKCRDSTWWTRWPLRLGRKWRSSIRSPNPQCQSPSSSSSTTLPLYWANETSLQRDWLT